MEHTDLVASELTQKGFVATIIALDKIRVSLKSRKVSKMEVEAALEQVFSDIQFKLTSVDFSVEVTIGI